MTNPQQTVAFLKLAAVELRRIADEMPADDVRRMQLRVIASKSDMEAKDLEAWGPKE